MKRSTLFLLAILVALCGGGAVAVEVLSPPKMDLVDAARLDAAIARIQAIELAAQREREPHERQVREICVRYKINPSELGRTVDVVPATGEIKRIGPAAAPPVPAAPKGPAVDAGARQ